MVNVAREVKTPRIRPLEESQLTPALREIHKADDPLPTLVYGHASKLAETWVPFAREISAPGLLGAKLKEAIRMRSAQINGCRR
ncbi:MAG: hypothetical protein HY329_22790 [Chloroflexi bacterium]|nr:hypothetical protein [Chloroflexota bacterium]